MAGVIVNSFADLEPGYAEHYERVTGKRVWMIGPVSLCNRDPYDVAERGRGVTPPEARRIFEWLDSKPAGSVLYVCFGSLCRLPLAQLKEIGYGLESSRVPFVWVIREGEEWAGEFAAGVAGRGVVVRGWAPQVGVLSHAAVGGFMTHCGWGSVTEAASAGVPMLTWPLFAEQFYNEVLVAEVAEVGVKVGAEVGFVWSEEERAGVVVGRERIAERVTWLMEKGEEVRKRARKLGEKARKVVEVGGSSYRNIGMLMEDMRKRIQQTPKLGKSFSGEKKSGFQATSASTIPKVTSGSVFPEKHLDA